MTIDSGAKLTFKKGQLKEFSEAAVAKDVLWPDWLDSLKVFCKNDAELQKYSTTYVFEDKATHKVLLKSGHQVFKPGVTDLSKLGNFGVKYIPQKMGNITDVELLKSLYGKRLNVMLEGPCGCGKNHLVNEVADELKKTVESVNLDGAAQVEDLVGQWTVKGGNTVWVDGLVTRAVRNGSILVIDEANASSADILFILHQLLDDRRKLTIAMNGGEIVPAHKDFWLVCIMNEGYEGVRELNEAFKDRLVWIHTSYCKEADDFYINGDKKLHEFVSHLRTAFARRALMTPCSTRLIKNFVQMRAISDAVAKDMFIGRFTSAERQTVKDTFESMLYV